ncbi:MAG TPA: ABC transporter permease [Bacillota bacterium]|nr:ABC transporter permease [Bacillota bacterium]
MLRRFSALVARDIKLVVRNHHLTIVVAVAVLYALLVRFLIPAELAFEPNLVIWDRTATRAIATWYRETEPGRAKVVDSEAAYEEALREANRIGVKVTGDRLPEELELTFQGFEGMRSRRLLEAIFSFQVTAMLRGVPPGFPATVLRPGEGGEQPALNLSLVPVLVLFEAAMLGMLLSAVLLFGEKDEQTLRAYRVSPGGIAEYLLARSLTMSILALISAAVLTLLTVGPAANWPVILAVVFLGSMTLTLAAMVLASLFRNVGQFYLPYFLITLVLMLPMVVYFQPGMRLPLIDLLPTYPLVYALREAYFPTGSPGVMTGAVLQLLATLAVVLPLAILTFRRQLVVKDV